MADSGPAGPCLNVRGVGSLLYAAAGRPHDGAREVG